MAGRTRMSASPWTPDPFDADVEHRADGSMLLRPREPLVAYPARWMDMLEHWAKAAPDRVFIARRRNEGDWQSLTYGEMLTRVRRVAAGLLGRGLSADRPIAILSGNSIEHLVLAFAAAWAGIPYCAVSPSYSLSSGELTKLRYVFGLLTPGLVAAFESATTIESPEDATTSCVH